MNTTEILYSVADGVATITLNRPTRLNAWTPTMESEVRAAMFAAEADDSARVIVITGAGKGFCSGADFEVLSSVLSGGMADFGDADAIKKKFFQGPDRPGERADFAQVHSYWLSIKKPIVAAINGSAAGLGFVLPLYADIRIAAESAKFMTSFVQRGLVAEYGVAWILPRVVGRSQACDLLLTGRRIDAQEALRIGMVSRILPDENFAQSVQQFASELATNSSPRSTRTMKKQLNEGMLEDLAQATMRSNEEMIQSFFCMDFQEGVAHYLEKRPPRFTGQ